MVAVVMVATVAVVAAVEVVVVVERRLRPYGAGEEGVV